MLDDPTGSVRGEAPVAFAQTSVTGLVERCKRVDTSVRSVTATRRSSTARSWRMREALRQRSQGLFDHATLESGDLATGYLVAREQLTPAPISKRGCASGRIHDIGEQHRGQNPIGWMLVPLPDKELLDLAGDRLEVPDGWQVVDGPLKSTTDAAWRAARAAGRSGRRGVADSRR